MADFFYNAIRRDITMIQNDTLSFAFQVQGLKGQTPDNIVFTCKETIETNEVLFSVDLSNNISLRDYDEDQDIYTYVVRIPPALTEKIALGRYFYDLQLTVNYDIFTLLKGRLTIEYQISGGSVEPEPQYDSGDDVLYPVDDIPVGTVKLYTEEYVNELIRKIQEITDSQDQVTISGASAVAETIQEQITEVVEVVNTVTGGSGNIPLSELPAAVNNVAGINEHNYIINNIHAFNENGGGFIYYPDDDHYNLSCTTNALIMRLLMESTGTRSNGVKYHFDIISASGNCWYNSGSGKKTFYPTINNDLTYAASYMGYGSEWSDETIKTFYNVDSWFYNLADNNLPVVKNVFGNEKKAKISSLLTSLKVKDLYEITTQNVAGVILLYLPSWEGSNSLLWVQDIANGVYYDTSDNTFHIRPQFWYGNIGGTKLNNKDTRSGLYRTRSYSYNVTLETLTEAMIFNTYDIKDQNGNVVIPANATLADFGL